VKDPVRDAPRGLNLRALLEACPDDLPGLRDRALLSVAYDTGLSDRASAAIDHIAPEISAMDIATDQVVAANAIILESVQAVRQSVRRTLNALDSQRQAVAVISTAMEESSLVASEISQTIAVVRGDASDMAAQTAALQSTFADVDEQLIALEIVSAAFVETISVEAAQPYSLTTGKVIGQADFGREPRRSAG
jgi:hypothetical protein